MGLEQPGPSPPAVTGVTRWDWPSGLPNRPLVLPPSCIDQEDSPMPESTQPKALKIGIAAGMVASALVVAADILSKFTNLLEKWQQGQRALEVVPDPVRWVALGLFV